jgi:hypothetical protein
MTTMPRRQGTTPETLSHRQGDQMSWGKHRPKCKVDENLGSAQHCLIWDRCYDFLKIFAEKFSKKLAFLTQNKAKLKKH